MTAQEPTNQETLKKDQIAFQEILSDDELDALFVKHHVQDERKRKLFVRGFFTRPSSQLTIVAWGTPVRRASWPGVWPERCTKPANTSTIAKGALIASVPLHRAIELI